MATHVGFYRMLVLGRMSFNGKGLVQVKYALRMLENFLSKMGTALYAPL